MNSATAEWKSKGALDERPLGGDGEGRDGKRLRKIPPPYTAPPEMVRKADNEHAMLKAEEARRIACTKKSVGQVGSQRENHRGCWDSVQRGRGWAGALATGVSRASPATLAPLLSKFHPPSPFPLLPAPSLPYFPKFRTCVTTERARESRDARHAARHVELVCDYLHARHVCRSGLAGGAPDVARAGARDATVAVCSRLKTEAAEATSYKGTARPLADRPPAAPGPHRWHAPRPPTPAPAQPAHAPRAAHPPRESRIAAF